MTHCACRIKQAVLWPLPSIGGDLVSTGLAGGCQRVGVVRVPVNKSGKPLIGESNYAMAA